MNRSFPQLIFILFLLLGVVTVAPSAVAHPFEKPIINDWLHNSTDEPASHVSNYSINNVDEYFIGGQLGPNTAQHRFNNTNTSKSIYVLYDPIFKEYQTTPVYEKWNSNNPYAYGKRTYIPDFKHNKTKKTKGSKSYNLGSDEYVIKNAWAGIYSISPSSYAHYMPPQSKDDAFGVSRQLVGDTVKVTGIVYAKQGVVPPTRTTGSGVGANRYSYSLKRMTYSAQVYIANSSKCPSRCYAGTAPVSNYVIELGNIEVSKFVEPGETFDIILEGTAKVTFTEDVDVRREVRTEVPCEDPENQTAPCYDYDLVWKNDTTNTKNHTVTIQDRQRVTYPKGLNAENVQSKVEYERGVYPNGTVEIHIDTSKLNGTVTDAAPWRMISLGHGQRVYSNWRVWSSRNMSWDVMYKSEDSDKRHLSHLRPLAFHTAPVTSGLTATKNVTFRRTEYSYYSFFYYAMSSERESYPSPYLLRHKTCKRYWPEQDNKTAYCGWWVTGTGNEINTTNSSPYIHINETGRWQVHENLYIKSPNSENATNTLDVYGLVPNEKTEIKLDKNVDINKSKLYVEILDKNTRNRSSNRSWVKIRITLVDAETNERLNTSARDESIIVQNAKKTKNGSGPAYVDTNDSGQVIVKVYNPSENNIHVAYKADDWTMVEDGKTAYVDATYTDSVSVPAFTVGKFLKMLIGYFTILYVVMFTGVRTMVALQIVDTSTGEELKNLFPGKWWRMPLWAIGVFILLSVL